MKKISALKQKLIEKILRLLLNNSDMRHPDVPLANQISHSKWPQYLINNFDKPGLDILEVGSRSVVFSGFKNKFKNANYTGFDYYHLIPRNKDNNLISVWIDKRMGYINFQGEIAIDPIYSFADNFSGGLARVDEGGLEGVINTKGDYVVEPSYDSIRISDNGYIYCQKNEKWTVLDRNGKLLIDAEYDEIVDFNKDGYGIVAIYEERDETVAGYGYLHGLINKKGEYVIEPIYDDMYFADDEDYIVFSLDDKYGCMDYEGNIILEPMYDEIDWFNEGFARIELDEKYGYINNKAEVIAESIYEYTLRFYQGLASVKKDGKYGYINGRGELVIEPIYDYADDFNNGLAMVRKDDKVGYINKSGEVVIPFEYLDGSYCDDNGYIVVAMTNEKFTIIDKNNEKVLEKEYDCLSYYMQFVNFCIEAQCSEEAHDDFGYCTKHKYEKGYCLNYECTAKRNSVSNYCNEHSYLR